VQRHVGLPVASGVATRVPLGNARGIDHLFPPDACHHFSVSNLTALARATVNA